MKNLKDKKVLVIGLGKSGVAAAKYCASSGASVTVTDSKPAEELQQYTGTLSGVDVEYALGIELSDASSYDMIVVSPGVPMEHRIVRSAQSKKTPVVGEMELAARLIKKPIVAVTGTNGKTTTTALIGHLLNSCGIKACVAGNIGTPALDIVDEANASETVVLEVSSFQMLTTPSLRPMIAVWLNATPDHIDRHGSFESYVESKARLVFQVADGGTAIYNAADEFVYQSVIGARCRLLPFDATGRIFGSDLTERDDPKGERAWYDGDALMVSSKGSAVNRYELEGVKLIGAGNVENMLAALCACELLGVRPDRLMESLRSFEGLPHRMTVVGKFDGVTYIDDSKATNVGAVLMAVEQCSKPIVLIAGGRSKGAEFDQLGESIRKHVAGVVLIGESAEKIGEAVGDSVKKERAASMDEAVAIARSWAESGGVVLFSPACSSFDMFKDYADRGNKFAEAVRKVCRL